MKFLQEYRRNNSYWLNRVLARSQEKPIVLDWARTIESDYASITLEELNVLATSYLNEDKVLRAVIIPE